MPGRDFRLAADIVLELCPDPVPFPELPMRDAASGMIGRTIGRLELPIGLDADGWRLTGGRSGQQATAARWWRHDLDDFEELADGHAGPVKIALTGPWTLAAQLLGPHPTMNHALADSGACRELGQAMALAAGELVAQFRLRLTRDIWLQIDEPLIGAVLTGRMARFSGLRNHRIPGRDEILMAWRAITEAVAAAGGRRLWLHSCAPDCPVELARRAGFNTLALDIGQVASRDLDPLAELLATGGELACGCWPTDRVSTPTADQIAGRAAEWLTQLGLPADLLAARVIMTPACGLGTWPIESATELLRQLGRATPRLAERLN